MRQKSAKKLRKLVKAQFGGKVNPAVVDKIYKRTKTAWNKTPRNQRNKLASWLQNANNLYKTINKNK